MEHTGQIECCLRAADAGNNQGSDQGSAPPDNGGSNAGTPTAGVRLWAFRFDGLHTHLTQA